jgi:RsiW-degrading membrane proteinase PrsW (M82 family)
LIIAGFLLSLAASVGPTALYALAFYWADRYEREPIWLALAAFLWGALPAIAVSLIVELAAGAPFVDAPGSMAAALVENAVVAPIVEEVAKALALLAIALFMRREFDGVLDGLTYGALIGFGFAMTENFFYFLGAFDEGGFGGLFVLVYLRAILFGLNHAFYTSLTGIGFGLGRESGRRLWRTLLPVAGLVAAIGVHSLHNLGSSLASVAPAAMLLTLMVAAGGVAVTLLAVALSWQRERSWIRAELAPEVGVLITDEDYRGLVERWRPPVRRSPANASREKRRRHLCVELALSKHRLRTLGAADDPTLPARIEELRHAIAQTYTPAPVAAA